MRILVAGGAGYIGSFTVRALERAGHDVVVFDNLCYGHPEAVVGELVVGDVADNSTLQAVFESGGIDAVVHFAAFIEAGISMVEGGRFFQNNTANTINLLNAMVRYNVTQFVFSSTAAVYGNPSSVPIGEEDPKQPTNVYGESKLLVERMLPWYDRVHGVRSMSLRYFNATGAALDGSIGQDHEPATHLITLAIKAALGQHRFVLFGDDYATPDGTCIRDYIHVLDLAEAHVLALDHLVSGGATDAFNVGTGKGYSVWEVVRSVKRVTGVDFPVEIGPKRAGDPAELIADATKIRSVTGWEPRHSTLDTIVQSAWEWHRLHPHGFAAPTAVETR